MILQDKLEKERNDAKNGVEEYVYDLRDKLCGIYEKYVTQNVSTWSLLSGAVVLLQQTRELMFYFQYDLPQFCNSENLSSFCKSNRTLQIRSYQNESHVRLIMYACWRYILQESNQLTIMLEDTENWLYEEGEDQEKEIYQDKLSELKVGVLLFRSCTL